MEEFSKYKFSAINVKKMTAVRFRKFSKEVSKSNTDTLEAMLEFFEKHQLSPDDEIPNHLFQVEKRLLKRINAVIAIIKDIEKTQTKPTIGMLQALFTADDKEKKTPMFVEKKQRERTLKEELNLWKESNES